MQRLDIKEVIYNAKNGPTFEEGTKIQGYSFINCDLRGVNFSGCRFKYNDFRLSDLTEANFRDAYLRGNNLSLCLLDGADFFGADLTHADVSFSTVHNSLNILNAKIEGLIGLPGFMRYGIKEDCRNQEVSNKEYLLEKEEYQRISLEYGNKVKSFIAIANEFLKQDKQSLMEMKKKINSGRTILTPDELEKIYCKRKEILDSLHGMNSPKKNRN